MSFATENSGTNRPASHPTNPAGLNPDWQFNTPQPSMGEAVLDAVKDVVGLYIDSLTNCHNRAFLRKFLETQFDPKKDDGKLAIVFIDFNKLKEMNDQFGHDFGNRAIIELIELIKKMVKSQDLIVRYGGDEFIVICRTDVLGEKNFLESLNERFKAIQRLISQHNQQIGRKEPEQLNFAFGAALYERSTDSEDLEATIKRADALMYQNKKAMKKRKEKWNF